MGAIKEQDDASAIDMDRSCGMVLLLLGHIFD